MKTRTLLKRGELTFIKLLLKYQFLSISEKIESVISRLITHVKTALGAEIYIPPFSD